MMIQFLTVVGRGVSTLIVVPMYDDNLLILGVTGHSITRSANFPVAPLRGRRRIVDHYIVHESAMRIIQWNMRENDNKKKRMGIKH